jgi:hypothetical protein
MTRLTYLASPYSHPDPEVRAARFRAVCQVAAVLMARGEFVYSPITHTHPIAQCGELPTGFDFWREYDRRMLAACDDIAVVRMKGWQESAGIAAELLIAGELGLPVRWLDPSGDQLRIDAAGIVHSAGY